MVAEHSYSIYPFFGKQRQNNIVGQFGLYESWRQILLILHVKYQIHYKYIAIYLFQKCLNSPTLHVDFPHEEDKQRWVSFPLTMFEELTVEPSSFVYLISLLFWKKPKRKRHNFQRICNSSELKTTRPAKHVILSLRGWARHPQVQTGFGFLCLRGRACVCVFDRVCRRRCAATKKNTLSSTPDEESKWLLSPFFTMLIEEPRYVPVLFSAGKGVSTFATVSLYACAFSCVCI